MVLLAPVRPEPASSAKARGARAKARAKSMAKAMAARGAFLNLSLMFSGHEFIAHSSTVGVPPSQARMQGHIRPKCHWLCTPEPTLWWS